MRELIVVTCLLVMVIGLVLIPFVPMLYSLAIAGISFLLLLLVKLLVPENRSRVDENNSVDS